MDLNDQLLRKNLSTLDDISELKYNWNGYGASAFSKELIDRCRDILGRLPVQPELYPTACDSIQFEWETADGRYMDVEVPEYGLTGIYKMLPDKTWKVQHVLDETLIDTLRKEVIEFIDEDVKMEFLSV